MEIHSNNNVIDPRLAQRTPAPASSAAPSARVGNTSPSTAPSEIDAIRLSRDLVIRGATQTAGAGQTTLIKDSIETLEKGYRRTQTFERADGRNFTRIEEFTVSDRNARRTVIQQNASGNTTRLDEVLERQNDGTFRRTQRFTDEAGDTRTQIETGFVSVDPFVLSGGASPSGPSYGTSSFGYNHIRGTQVDLHA